MCNKVWALSVPGKVKTFVWKVLHGAIPVKSTLTDRHIGTDDRCPVCHDHPEDLKHLLFECAPAKTMWNILKLEQAVLYSCIVDRSGSAVLELLDSSTSHYPDLPQGGIAEVVAIAT